MITHSLELTAVRTWKKRSSRRPETSLKISPPPIFGGELAGWLAVSFREGKIMGKWLVNGFSIDLLAGGNSNIFGIFSPKPWGKMNPFRRTYFLKCVGWNLQLVFYWSYFCGLKPGTWIMAASLDSFWNFHGQFPGLMVIPWAFCPSNAHVYPKKSKVYPLVSIVTL